MEIYSFITKILIVRVFRLLQRIKEFDAVLLVSLEYNRSVPAVINNALDVGSRPYGQSEWDNKSVAVVAASSGEIGSFCANHHLR